MRLLILCALTRTRKNSAVMLHGVWLRVHVCRGLVPGEPHLPPSRGLVPTEPLPPSRGLVPEELHPHRGPSPPRRSWSPGWSDHGPEGGFLRPDGRGPRQLPLPPPPRRAGPGRSKPEPEQVRPAPTPDIAGGWRDHLLAGPCLHTSSLHIAGEGRAQHAAAGLLRLIMPRQLGCVQGELRPDSAGRQGRPGSGWDRPPSARSATPPGPASFRCVPCKVLTCLPCDSLRRTLQQVSDPPQCCQHDTSWNTSVAALGWSERRVVCLTHVVLQGRPGQAGPASSRGPPHLPWPIHPEPPARTQDATPVEACVRGALQALHAGPPAHQA